MDKEGVTREAIRLLGFSVRIEPTRAVRVDNSTGAERDLTAPEANLWADACQQFKASTLTL
jgi:hypothetical protein